jgi:hypothetical protein
MSCDPDPHTWLPTGRATRHLTAEPAFRYGTPIVTYLRCARCGQTGYSHPPRRVVYTWAATKNNPPAPFTSPESPLT